MEDSLNLQNCVVRDRRDDGERVWYTVNSEETAKAQEKQAVLREKFSGWIMEHPDIRNKYVDYYNRTYNNTRLRQYDGSHLTFRECPQQCLENIRLMQLQESFIQ